MTSYKSRYSNKQIVLLMVVAIYVLLSSCKKYLDIKPDKRLVQPSSLQDAQALLDYYVFMNAAYPQLGPEADDDYYLLDVDYNRMTVPIQKRYTWQLDAAVSDNDWGTLYKAILSANMALETVNRVPMSVENKNDWQRIKGSALYFRAYSFYWVAMYFTTPYNESIASISPGVPLRLTSDVNEKLSRGTIKQTYDQIIGDLRQSILLLPNTAETVSRPSKAASYGFLARVYMTMRDYTKAGAYADSCLQIKKDLLNYNEVNASASTPFKNFNKEVVFHSEAYSNSATYSPTAKTDTTLYALYEANDLRKQIFYSLNSNGTHSFKGSYAGSNYYDVPFNGIATDEMYLLRAECYARNNTLDKAIADLNTLLANRYITGTYMPKDITNQQAVLKTILIERRKELVGRSLRWIDLRRLNFEPDLQKTLIRKENGQTFQLPPNDGRYTFLLPPAVVTQNGWVQNER